MPIRYRNIITKKGNSMRMTRLASRHSLLRHLTISIAGALLLAVLFSLYTLLPASAASSQAHTPTSGSGGTIYVHTATTANSAGDYTNLDNPVTNNNPNALVFVTPNWNPGGVSAGNFDYHNIGVWYNAGAGKWSIFNQDLTSVPVGSAFNVYAVPGNGFSAFVQTATTANSAGDYTDINNSLTNNQPNAELFVTPNWNPNGVGGVYDNHVLGVWYHSGKWSIFHEDGTAIPNGASFNVSVQPSSVSGLFIHTATAANSTANYTRMDNAFLNNNPNAIAFVTPNWNPGGIGGTFNNQAIGVFYDTATSKWCIFNQFGAAIPNGAAFNVVS